MGGARGAVPCLQGLEEVMGTRNVSNSKHKQNKKKKTPNSLDFGWKCVLVKGERVLAGVSGTNQRSESPEKREKGQCVRAKNVPGINSSKMNWVLLRGCILRVPSCG